MNKPIAESLGNPKPIRFGRNQWTALNYISQRNHEIGMFKLARIGADLLIRVTELNGGQIPMLDQVRLQRVLARRARRDARRKS